MSSFCSVAQRSATSFVILWGKSAGQLSTVAWRLVSSMMPARGPSAVHARRSVEPMRVEPYARETSCARACGTCCCVKLFGAATAWARATLLRATLCAGINACGLGASNRKLRPSPRPTPWGGRCPPLRGWADCRKRKRGPTETLGALHLILLPPCMKGPR